MSWWTAAAGLNAVVAIAHFVIGTWVVRALLGAGGLWANPLALGTGALFLAGAAHHGNLSAHLVVDSDNMRDAFVWHVTAVDALTAGVAVSYLGVRSRFPALARGSVLFEDLRERERQALEIHDNVVQGLAEAQMAFDVGRPQQAREAVDRTLVAARRLITERLGEPGSGIELRPGALRRSRPADRSDP
jgi:signal transduction histidine kinase